MTVKGEWKCGEFDQYGNGKTMTIYRVIAKVRRAPTSNNSKNHGNKRSSNVYQVTCCDVNLKLNEHVD